MSSASLRFLLADRYHSALPGMIADPIDFESGEYLSICRSFDPTDSAVFTALRTVRESGSAVQNVGHRFHEHPLVDERLELFFRQELDYALRDLVRSGQIQIQRVEVATDGADWAELHVWYLNLAAQAERHASGRISALAVR